jgi:hypothetical protein
MNIKLQHGRVLMRRRVDGRYVKLLSQRPPLDLEVCRARLHAKEMAQLHAWLARHPLCVSTDRLPHSRSPSIAPVYVDHVVQAVEAACGLAVAVLQQPHLAHADRQRLVAVAQRFWDLTKTDQDFADDCVVITEDPEDIAI